jgi:two-component system, chemotaxis family, chemotaxis protein CheY
MTSGAAPRAVWSILVVDDSHFVRSQLRSALEAHGARVTEAQNGSEGLWRAREQAFDLIVVDIHMPVMDGLRMIQEVRKLPEHGRTPIFVLTTDAATTRAEQGKNAGATAWLLKPVNLDLLWSGIQKVLTSSPARAASEQPVKK